MRRWPGLLAVCVLALSACGGGDDDTTESAGSTRRTTTTEPTTTTTEPTTTTQPPSPYAPGPIRVTTAEGWNFDYTPAIGQIEVAATKDISNSPPGRARVKIVLRATDVADFPGEFVGVDEGREADPAVTAVFLQWDTPEMRAALDAVGTDITWPSGHISGNVPTCNLEPHLVNVTGPGCDMDDDEIGGLITHLSDEAPESVVDAFIAANPFSAVPAVRVTMQTDVAYTYAGTPVSIYLLSDGTSRVE